MPTVEPMDAVKRARRVLRRKVVELLSEQLTKPSRSYQPPVPNNLSNLKEHLHKGDIVLVEGDQRVSQVIRYLTQSSWSHAAFYIGDELRRFRPELAAALTAQYGDEARHLVIEALAEEGVICSPIAKYVRYNLRVCRPRSLHRDDLDQMIEEVLAQLGCEYDVRHIFDLGRYFLPVSLIPRRFRLAALHYGGRTTREVICSTMLARAFAKIGYPILPRVTLDGMTEQTHHWLRRLIGRNGHGPRALYRAENPALITPRDFDLSPYFEIIKFNHLYGGKFDYRRIAWVTDDGQPVAATASNGNGHGAHANPVDAAVQKAARA